jgi:hypothetical protein
MGKIIKLFASLLCLSEIDAASVSSQNKRSPWNPSSGQAQAFLATSDKEGLQMKREYPFYHTSVELRAEAQRLLDKCTTHASLETHDGDGVSIDVIRVKSQSKNPINRFFLIFGEHSRELISPESGLAFLQMLCNAESGSQAANVLEDTDFMMVLNGNPRSREKVEGGDYCIRTNPDGVDLNRNWDEKWTQESKEFGSDSNPGPSPFSEPETRIFRKVVSHYMPTTFLTVHSGTRGLYMPWAYDRNEMATRNKANMMSVLQKVDSKYCKCPFGAAGTEVGYPCPGTSIDWVYDQLKAPYSFAFEIFVDPIQDDSLKQRWEEKVRVLASSFLQHEHQVHRLGSSHFKSLYETHSSDFVHSNATSKRRQAREQCFSLYNPVTEALYNKTVDNWARAYLDMAEIIAAQMKQAPSQQM